jgi:molybdopterin-guanine dinucleotide biosynthesis protein MobB
MGQRLLPNAQVPVVGFIAPRGNVTMDLLSQVTVLLQAQQVRIAMVKEAPEDFDMDQPGKDSYRLRKAGVERLLITSSRKSALLLEHPKAVDPTLNDLLALLHQDVLDVVLVEGFAQQAFPKIELQWAPSPLRHYPADPHIIAIGTDQPDKLQVSIPILDLRKPSAVAEFLMSLIHAHPLP